MSAAPIYLDFNATTPVDPAVVEAMLPYLRDRFGNPSSGHAYGKAAAEGLAHARAQVAALLEAAPAEIVFTSCATESINLAIKGIAFARRKQGKQHLVLSAVEHPAAAESCAYLEREHGFKVTRVPPEPDGRVDRWRLMAAVRDDTALVTLIHAQNETGALQPVQEIGETLRSRGVPFHVDASQSAGKLPVSVRALACDALSLAGHKLYAPKGVGALFIRRGISLPPLIVGAGQEHGVRPGTENVAFIVGLGAACRIAADALERSRRTITELAASLLSRLQKEIPGLTLVGDPVRRLPNTLNVLLPDVSGRLVLEACSGVLASTGSACHADSEEPSAILTALGIPRTKALGAVRLSLGRSTTQADITTAASDLARAWRSVRSAPATTKAQ